MRSEPVTAATAVGAEDCSDRRRAAPLVNPSAVHEIRRVATRSVVEPLPRTDALYIAVVHGPEGVRFATTAKSRADLLRQLTGYVRRRGDQALWEPDARYLRSLLARGELEAAVEVYFGRVRGRWDGEWLVSAAVVTAADTEEGASRTSARHD
jgi:hypothetical protein